MSAAASRVRATRRAMPQVPSQFLRLVSGRVSGKPRPRVFYATVTVGVALAIIVAQIVLSVTISSGAYEVATLQRENKELSRTFTQVSQTLAEVSSPQHVAAAAEGLGMVSSASPAYLHLSDSRVLGQPRAATRSGALLSGADGSLVQNILLTDIAAGTVPAAAAAARAAGNIPTTGVAAAGGATAAIPLPGVSSQTIPAPQTR
jgi:cell division protein FtsL